MAVRNVLGKRRNEQSLISFLCFSPKLAVCQLTWQFRWSGSTTKKKNLLTPKSLRWVWLCMFVFWLWYAYSDLVSRFALLGCQISSNAGCVWTVHCWPSRENDLSEVKVQGDGGQETGEAATTKSKFSKMPLLKIWIFKRFICIFTVFLMKQVNQVMTPKETKYEPFCFLDGKNLCVMTDLFHFLPAI